LKARAKSTLDKYLIAGWRSEWKRLWSVRVTLFWGALSGLVSVWSAFSDVLPLWVYSGFSVVASILLGVARLTKQPGLD
jgi:hypothetical protein